MVKLGFTLKRPDWIDSLRKQRVGLLRDCSYSMKGKKARDAAAGSAELVAEAADPANKDGFEIAVIDFNDDARVVHDVTPATHLDGKIAALRVGGNGTNMTSPLEAALPIIRRVPNDGSYLRSVTLLFTDGQHNTGPEPETAADQIKSISDLVTVAFGRDADEDRLIRLATSPQHFYRCRNGAELRAFLAKVGQTLTDSLAAGQNATIPLASISNLD